RVVLDERGEDLGFVTDFVAPATGEARVGRAVATLAPRPWLWPRTVRLARQRRTAERRLGAFLAAFLGPDRPALGLDAPAAAALFCGDHALPVHSRDRPDRLAAAELVGRQQARAGPAHAGAAAQPHP